MYHHHFGLNEVPFSIKVNPSFLFMTDQHKDALAHLLYGTSAEGGFALLTGEVGTGKTTLIRALLQKLPENVDIALVMNPAINAVELLATICDELKIEHEEKDQRLKALTDKLHHYLLESYAQGRSAVVLIDEAQHLQFEALEQIRLLTNLETDTKKLLQIILVGQPELDDKLHQPELRQLAQRITARFNLGPLNHQETTAYIKHRLKIAGLAKEQTLFSEAIIRRIYEKTEGVPRLINVLCDRILLGSYAKNITVIDDQIVDQATREVFGTPRRLSASNTANSNLRINNTWANWAAMLFLVTAASVMALRGAGLNEAANSMTKITSPTATVTPPTETAPIAKSSPEPTLTAANLSEQAQRLPVAPIDLSVAAPIESEPTVQQQQTSSEQSSEEWWQGSFEGRNDALNALLQNLDLISDDESTPCLSIESAGIACYDAQMETWQDLLQINRVSVLQIRSPARLTSYVPILNLYPNHAALLLKDEYGNQKVKRVSLTELGELWTGEATAIWQIPAGYERPVGVKAKGPIVRWIADRFADIDGREDRLADNRFTAPLAERVALFQKSYGLQDDGIVGINTILKLSDASGLVTHLLLQTAEPELTQ